MRVVLAVFPAHRPPSCPLFPLLRVTYALSRLLFLTLSALHWPIHPPPFYRPIRNAHLTAAAMPPMMTSTTVTTFLRKVVHAARHVHPHLPVAEVGAGPRPPPLHNVHHQMSKFYPVLRRLALSTFPSLSTPAYKLVPEYAYQPIKLATQRRGFVSAGHTSRTMGMISRRPGSAFPPAIARSPAINSVGLGTARTFASGPATSAYAKVPMGLRAFASLLDDNEDLQHRLPRPRRYVPYAKPASHRIRRVRRSTCTSASSQHSGLLEEMSHYFPTPLRSVKEQQIPLPPLPESLVTPGRTTILSLPLSPSLHSLLSPTPSVPYREAEVGVNLLARLTKGLMPLHEAFSTYSSTRIIPLLAKLEGLGVLTAGSLTTMDVVLDHQGQPDVLRIIFEGRSKKDVLQLLGESLRSAEEEEFWVLEEEPTHTAVAVLNAEESRAILEEWGAPETRAPRSPAEMPVTASLVQSHELIFPTIDLGLSTYSDEISWPSSASGTPPVAQFDDILEVPSRSPSPSPTSPRSGFDTPETVDIPASLFSRLSSENLSWHIGLSESDSDIESSMNLSDRFSDVSEAVWEEHESVEMLERPGSAEPYAGWSGVNEGFGFAQPW